MDQYNISLVAELTGSVGILGKHYVYVPTGSVGIWTKNASLSLFNIRGLNLAIDHLPHSVVQWFLSDLPLFSLQDYHIPFTVSPSFLWSKIRDFEHFLSINTCETLSRKNRPFHSLLAIPLILSQRSPSRGWSVNRFHLDCIRLLRSILLTWSPWSDEAHEVGQKSHGPRVIRGKNHTKPLWWFRPPSDPAGRHKVTNYTFEYEGLLRLSP